MIREISATVPLSAPLQRFYWRVVWWVAWHVAQRSPRVHGRGPLLAAMGDSLTDPFVGFVFPWQVWVRRLNRHGYRTLNLGRGGETTTDMRRRVNEFTSEGRPDVAVLFAGNCDVEQGIDPADTERNITYIVEWLRAQGVSKIALIAPGIVNLERLPSWLAQVRSWEAAAEPVRSVFRRVAESQDAVFVDLAAFQRQLITRGEVPDFSVEPYRQSRSWHASGSDGHYNAYGYQLVAEAFVSATAHWCPERRRQRPLIGRPAVARMRS